MSVDEVLKVVGGVASRGLLSAATSRREVDRAIADGQVTRIARGRYAVAAAHEGTVVAARAAGHVCLTNAALSYGWAVKQVPERPHVAVPKHRRLSDDIKQEIVPHWIDLADDDVEGRATSPAKTLEMCGRHLPFADALAVADSALRSGFQRAELEELGRSASGPGSRQLRRVCAQANGLAANPFESALRAIALDVPGLCVEPQVQLRGELGLSVRPDLVDRQLLVVLEADSFEWHGDRAALRADARRYDLLVANGWLVLRFAWEDVMFEPHWVRAVLTALVAGRTNQRPPCGCPA